MAQSKKRRVALLFDTANCRDGDFEETLRIARRHGDVVVSRAYGNFTHHHHLGDMAEALFLLGVQLIHCPGWHNGSGNLKSIADEVLMNDVHELLRTRRSVNRFILCTGDGHFVPTIRQIQRQGREAIVMANPDAVSRLIMQAADKFIPLPPVAVPVPRAVLQTLVDAVRALHKAQSRIGGVPARGVKPEMAKQLGGFDETHYHSRHGSRLRSFTAFLQDAEAQGWVRLRRQDGTTFVSTVSKPVPDSAFQGLVDAVKALQNGKGADAVPRVSIKPKMIQRLNGFDETDYHTRQGQRFTKFTDFLEEAEARGWVQLTQEGQTMLVTLPTEHSLAA